MILTNAQSLHSVGELRKAAQLAMETIEPLFKLAMETSAKIRGYEDANVGTEESRDTNVSA
jgi:hypothetical protein